jgi:hypothetical protein
MAQQRDYEMQPFAWRDTPSMMCLPRRIS